MEQYNGIKAIVLSPDQMKNLERLGLELNLSSALSWFKFTDDPNEQYQLRVTQNEPNYVERIFAYTVQDMLDIMRITNLIAEDGCTIQIHLNDRFSKCCFKGDFIFGEAHSETAVNLIDAVYFCLCDYLKDLQDNDPWAEYPIFV